MVAMETKPGDLEGLAKPTGKATEEEAKPIKPSEEAPEEEVPKPKAEDPALAVEDVPDPDEDDLDDLDDMLDEFNPSEPEPKAPAIPSGPGRPIPSVPDLAGEGIDDEEFAEQLQKGMAELLGELETSPDMQTQFATMMKELGGAAALGDAAASAPGSSVKDTPATSKATAGPSSTAGEASFQETIKKTMERMQASGASATAAASSTGEEDMLAEMMKAMGAMDGEGSEEDFSKMILGMMEQLTNKEILYEPMKELNDKFPEWMEKNEGKVSIEDMKRYKEQQTYVKEIVGRFERTGYSDENAADREYIVERMQKMQAAGTPPPDLVGSMDAAQEAFGAPDEGCPTQ